MTPAKWDPAPVPTDHLAKAPPHFLYHYTNQRGLLGILQSHAIWASNIHYLNDHKEYDLGVRLIMDEVRRLRTAAEGVSEQASHLDAMLTAMKQRFPIATAYVASWTAADDDLAQWRAYSDGGVGFSICVPGQVLKGLAEAQQFMFAPCIYDPGEQLLRAGEIVGVSLGEMVEDKKEGVHYERAGPADKFVFRVGRFAPLFKHESFAAEREWRLVTQYAGVEFGPMFAVREGRSMLVPHTSLSLKTADGHIDVREIVVGPCAEPDLARQAAYLAFQRYVPAINAQERGVRSSNVPYRNW